MDFPELQEKVFKEQKKADITAKYEEDLLTINRCIDKLLEIKTERTAEYLKQLKGVQDAQ